jgi:hypothetical protein
VHENKSCLTRLYKFPRTTKIFQRTKCFINRLFKNDLLNHWPGRKDSVGPAVYDVTGGVSVIIVQCSCGFEVEETSADVAD